MKKYLTTLLVFALALASAETSEPIGEASNASVEQAKTLRWKANLFAGTALLAVVAGIVVICLDGGSSSSAHKQERQSHCCDPSHRHGHHHPDHQFQTPLD